jgi:hypothetical protein
MADTAKDVFHRYLADYVAGEDTIRSDTAIRALRKIAPHLRESYEDLEQLVVFGAARQGFTVVFPRKRR